MSNSFRTPHASKGAAASDRAAGAEPLVAAGEPATSAPMATKQRPSKRDAGATREKILQAGIAEFCAHGYSGARTARIARRARCNIRMIYHYYGSKEALYVAALERVYGEIRAREEELDLLNLDPVAGIAALCDFTFDHMFAHQDFVKLVVIENVQQGRHLRKSKVIPLATQPLVETIGRLLRRGEAQGIFRRNVDPTQLYFSIMSMSYIHLSNKHTLSISYRQDLEDPQWLAARRRHVRDVVLGFLRP